MTRKLGMICFRKQTQYHDPQICHTWRGHKLLMEKLTQLSLTMMNVLVVKDKQCSPSIPGVGKNASTV